MPEVPLAEAQAEARRRITRLPAIEVPLDQAYGLVLDEPVAATDDIPPFANTAMDGYALRAADTAGAPVVLRVVGTIAAGAPPDIPVGPGEAVRIMTGAPIPPGADAVVMVERTAPAGDGSVRIDIEATVGQHIRPAGDDVREGESVLAPGVVLRPGHLGVLASLGRRSVRVVRRARVGVLSTGDELVTDGSPLQPGQIRESNRPALLGLVRQAGAEPVDLGTVRDDEAAITAAIRAGVDDCDALLTSGGVSVGDFDWVKVILDRLGDMRWMQVAIRPAKPLAVGAVDGVPVFGLPGNPVSSMVSFELFARPAIRLMMGDPAPDRALVPGIAPDGLPRRSDGKTHFVRVRSVWTPDGLVVHANRGQGSHQLRDMAEADALAVVPDGDGVAPGGRVEVLPLW